MNDNLLPPLDFEARAYDRKIAQMAGWYLEKGCIYSPSGTNHGGSYLANIGRIEVASDVINSIWNSYCPRFSTDTDYAMSLLIATGLRWRLLGHGSDWWKCSVGAMDDVECKTASLAMCKAWELYMGWKRAYDPTNIITQNPIPQKDAEDAASASENGGRDAL